MAKQLLITYYEYYPHYMATSTTTMTLAEFDQLCEAASKMYLEGDIGADAEDRFDLMKDCLNARSKGDTIFALHNALMDHKNNIKKIRKAMVSGKVWSDQWEEGSFAFSPIGKKPAVQAVVKIEAKVLCDDLC